MARPTLLAAAVALLGAACSRGEPERLTVGVARLPASALVYVAEANGYFAAHGLAVERRTFETGRDALAALAAGEVDAATAYTTPVALRAGRDDLEALTTLHASTRLTRIVARGDRGIARSQDLAGRRIGVPLGTSGEYFLHTVLAYAGIEASVSRVDLSPAEAVDALAEGRVDAIVAWPPYVYRARARLGRAAIEIPGEVYPEISVLVVRDATHRARRPALVKLVRALADAERLVHERPERAFEALRAEFPEFSEAELRETWEAMRPVLGVTHELAAVLEREAAWFRDRGRTSGPQLDAGAVLDPEVLAEVDPEAVTFVSPYRGKAAR